MKTILVLCLFFPVSIFAQAIGINEDGSQPVHNAILDIKSNSKGIVIPRMSTSERNQIALPYTEGLMIYNTTTKQFEYWTVENQSIQWKSITLDDDNDPTNEIQTLTKNQQFLTLSNGGGSVSINDEDADPFNEWQTLSLQAGRILQLNPGGGSVTFPANLDNDFTNELQTISINGDEISLSLNGSTITLPQDEVNDADANPSNELQTLSFSSGQLSISNGNTVSITGPDNLGNHNASQELVMNDNRISLIGDPIFQGDATPKSYVDAHEDADADATNEIQNLFKNGNEISISGGNTITIPGDNLGNSTALQNLNMNTYRINNVGPPISSGDAVNKAYVDANISGDTDPTNEIQDLNLAFDTLYITNNPSPYKIGLNKYLDNTDNQNISGMTLLNDILTITMENAGAAQVNLSSLNQDDQGFDVAQLLGNTLRLSIEDDGDATQEIDFSSIANTDSQTLSKSGTNLFISGGNSLDIKQNFIGDSDNSSMVETQAASDRITFTTNSTKVAEFNSLGNLAINNNTPGGNNKLDVKSTLAFGVGVFANATGANGIGLKAEGTEYAAQFNDRVDINDDLEVQGRITMDESSSDVILNMRTSGVTNGRVLLRQAGTNDIYFGDLDDNGADVVIRAAGGNRMVLGSSGDVALYSGDFYSLDNTKNLGNTNNRWNWLYLNNGIVTGSDIRLKKNISDLNVGLDEVLRMRPVSYRLKHDDTEVKLGIIAQELQEVIPELVHSPDDADASLGVKYTEIIPVLIKGMQEQQELIESLRNEMELLKKQQKMNEKELKLE